MTRSFLLTAALGVSSLFSIACSGTTRASGGAAPQVAGAPNAPVAATGRYPFTAADVHFMSGMIPHHAQAVLIAGWAPSHGARTDVRLLCERIVVAQKDEIALMQTWLRDRNQPVVAADATHLRMKMDGVEHDMLMPGMLTPEELAQLDRARGSEFDRLFLMAMIKHHEGAISMVDQLFGSEGAGQDEIVFRFASDVYADQTTEIERMTKMLAAQPAGTRP
jgi:uncharacterized protein (DUF305 family)